MALVTTGAQKKSVRMRPVMIIRLRGVAGLMSPYLGKQHSIFEARKEGDFGRTTVTEAAPLKDLY